jgi:hypothetical protein
MIRFSPTIPRAFLALTALALLVAGCNAGQAASSEAPLPGDEPACELGDWRGCTIPGTRQGGIQNCISLGHGETGWTTCAVIDQPPPPPPSGPLALEGSTRSTPGGS